MKPGFVSKMTMDELKFLALPSLALDVLFYLCSVPFRGFTLAAVLGLLLGNAAMFANMALLGYSSERAVERSGKSARRYMLTFYFIRFAVMGAAMALAFRSELFDGVLTVVSLLYPKLIYTLSAIFPRKGG